MNRPRWMSPQLFIHAARNALAGVGSLALAQALHLSEPFWACITTFVVLQSQLRPTLDSSWQPPGWDRAWGRRRRMVGNPFRSFPAGIRRRRLRDRPHLRGT